MSGTHVVTQSSSPRPPAAHQMLSICIACCWTAHLGRIFLTGFISTQQYRSVAPIYCTPASLANWQNVLPFAVIMDVAKGSGSQDPQSTDTFSSVIRQRMLYNKHVAQTVSGNFCNEKSKSYIQYYGFAIQKI